MFIYKSGFLDTQFAKDGTSDVLSPYRVGELEAPIVAQDRCLEVGSESVICLAIFSVTIY